MNAVDFQILPRVTIFNRFFIYLPVGLLLLALTSRPGSAQTLEQHTGVDSLAAGDLFSFTITLKKDQSYDQVIYPDSASFPSDIELRDRQQYHVTGFKDSLRYELQFWATDSTRIPALPVQLVAGSDTTTLFTRPVPLGFKSVLQEENEELRPLKPIYDFAAAWWPYLLGLFLLLLGGGLLYYYYRYYRQQPEAEARPEFTPQPFLNPLRELENNLRQLQNVTLTKKEHFEQFYISLGNAIRLYYEQMYRIPAMESTSREIIHELNRRAIDERLIEQTRMVLKEADMVKFANFTPAESQARSAYAKAEAFLSIVRELHGPRIQQMRRQHLTRVEEARKAFQDRQNCETDTEEPS